MWFEEYWKNRKNLLRDKRRRGEQAILDFEEYCRKNVDKHIPPYQELIEDNPQPQQSITPDQLNQIFQKAPYLKKQYEQMIQQMSPEEAIEYLKPSMGNLVTASTKTAQYIPVGKRPYVRRKKIFRDILEETFAKIKDPSNDQAMEKWWNDVSNKFTNEEWLRMVKYIDRYQNLKYKYYFVSKLILEKLGYKKIKETNPAGFANPVYVTQDTPEENIVSKKEIMARLFSQNIEDVKWALQQGIDVNTHGLSGSTRLHKAVRQDDLEIVKLLLAQPGINVNAMDIRNLTPMSCSKGSQLIHANPAKLQIIELLKAKGGIGKGSYLDYMGKPDTINEIEPWDKGNWYDKYRNT